MLNVRLSLHEKLRDLRDERKLKLAEVSQETGIPLSTLQRMESDEDTRVGYQDVATLANFYQVSTDYLFGLTNHRQHRSVEIDKLGLTDAAVAVLKEQNCNPRLVSELLASSDFPALIRSIEVYIDQKIQPQINTMNTLYKLAENTLKEHGVSADDEILAFLSEAVVDENEYLRYRISERFNVMLCSLFDLHKKDALSDEQTDILKEYKEDIKLYIDTKKKEGIQRGQAVLFAKKIGLNLSCLSDEEIGIFIRVLNNADKVKRTRAKLKR